MIHKKIGIQLDQAILYLGYQFRKVKTGNRYFNALNRSVHRET